MIKLHLKPPKWIPFIDVIYEPVIKSGSVNGDYYGIGTCISNVLDNIVFFHPGLLTTGVATMIFYDIKNQIGIGILSNSFNTAA